MKTNFKKITAVAASFLVAGLTLGTASAAQYPAPFKDNGSVDAAIVYGSDAASTDQTAASNIQEDLDLPSTTSVSVGGSSVDLHRDNSRLYLGDSLNDEQSSALDDDEMPEVLSEETFGGVDDTGSSGVDYDQEVTVGNESELIYDQQPSDDEDPVVGWETPADADNNSSYVFKYTLDFDDPVDFTSEDSIGEVIEMQGEEYAVSANTGPDNLYLTESAEELNLEYGPDATGVQEQDISVGGESYTVRLDSAADDAARVTVTGPDGSSETESIDEDSTSEVHDLTVTPTYANPDDVGNVVSASLVVSGEEGQIKLSSSGDSVEVGTDENTVDGTYATANGDDFDSADSITVYSSAQDDDENAVTMDHAFTDPAFGNLNVVLEEFSSGTDMDSEGRETFSIENNDDESATIDFTSHEGNGQSMEWYANSTDYNGELANDDEEIHVVENATVSEDEFVVISNEESGSGAILELTEVDNNDNNPSDDKVSFENVLTGNTIDADIIDGNVSGGLDKAEITDFVDTYEVRYNETGGGSGDGFVRIDYPGSASGEKVVFPTIETSEGARLAFTEPVNVSNTTLMFPDGDEGYDSYDINTGNLAGGGSETEDVGTWAYDINNMSGTYQVSLNNTGGNAAVHLIEEESDEDEYGSVIVEMGESDDEVEVADTHFTSEVYTPDEGSITHESNDDMSSKIDFWGTKVMTDSSGDQDSVEISYPDSQLYADTVLTSSAETEESSGNIMYTDSETSSYEDRNIIVVGGSAVNEAAAQLMGVEYPTGGSDFTDAAGISQGEFLVRGYESPWNEDKVALLVAGYSASDTESAANWVTSNDFDSSNVDYTGPTSGQ